MVIVMDVENVIVRMVMSGKIVHAVQWTVLKMMKIKSVVAMGNVIPVPMIFFPVVHVQMDGVMITDGQIARVLHLQKVVNIYDQKKFVLTMENVNVENANVIKDTKENIVKKKLTKILCAKNQVHVSMQM